MQLKHKIAFLAVLPLLVAVIAIGLIMWIQALRLADTQVKMMEESFLAARRAELTHNVSLAMSSIDHLYKAGRDDDRAKEEAKQILRSMNYSEDGYFFVYDLEGNNLVHPRIPKFEGQNLWELRDTNGLPVIQNLIARAKEGGGFQRYLWEKPSTHKITPKLGYAVKLDRWGWMLGTGLYLDDLELATLKLREDVSANIVSTMWWLAGVAVISILLVFACGMALNVSEHRLADGKLKTLAQRIVTSQEAERARVSRELHDGISQLLVAIKFRFEQVQQRMQSASGEPIRDLGKELAGLQSAIVEVRRISHALRPSLLDTLGLTAALEQLGNEFAERTGVRTSVHAIASHEALPEDQAVTFFRIAQEALNNIEKHARARSVMLDLDRAGASLRLAIVDDGCGFDVDGIDGSARIGIGLRNIRERLEHHGGSLAVASAPGRTELVATLPLCAAA